MEPVGVPPAPGPALAAPLAAAPLAATPFAPAGLFPAFWHARAKSVASARSAARIFLFMNPPVIPVSKVVRPRCFGGRAQGPPGKFMAARPLGPLCLRRRLPRLGGV